MVKSMTTISNSNKITVLMLTISNKMTDFTVKAWQRCLPIQFGLCYRYRWSATLLWICD
jgi:hypothetical protein